MVYPFIAGASRGEKVKMMTGLLMEALCGLGQGTRRAWDGGYWTGLSGPHRRAGMHARAWD